MTAQPSKNLAQLLGRLAVRVQDQTDRQATLRAIVQGAVATVPGAQWAGVSLISGRTVRAEVPTHPIVADLDQLQSTLNEGPCLSALRDMHTVLIDDMEAEQRWPRFTRAALSRGVRSSLSFQLFVRSRNLGALNLYSADVGVFGEESMAIGEILAQHASVALMGATTEGELRRAVASRDLIGQAKGLLMQRDNLSGLQAFQLLIQVSQETNMKLAEVARWLVDEHEARLGRSPEP